MHQSFGAEYLRLDSLPGVNHMRGMQYENLFSNSTNTVA